jgi:hypothetical protein
MSVIKRILRSIAIVAAALGVLLMIYLGSYFAVAKSGSVKGPSMNGEARFFAHSWQVEFFRPATKLESAVSKDKIYALHWDMSDDPRLRTL